MDLFIFITTLVLLVLAALGLGLTIRSKQQSDRILVMQLMSTLGTALILALSVCLDAAVLVDVGLVFALLAAVTTVAFVQNAWGAGSQ